MMDIIQLKANFFKGLYVKRVAASAEKFEFSKVQTVSNHGLTVKDAWTDLPQYDVSIDDFKYWEYVEISTKILDRLNFPKYNLDYILYPGITIAHDKEESEFWIEDPFGHKVKQIQWLHEVQGLVYFYGGKMLEI